MAWDTPITTIIRLPIEVPTGTAPSNTVDTTPALATTTVTGIQPTVTSFATGSASTVSSPSLS